MSKSLNITVRSRQVNNATVWEAVACVPGLQSSKIVRRTTNTTTFATRSALLSAARSVALSLGFTGVTETKPTKKLSTKKTTALTQQNLAVATVLN